MKPPSTALLAGIAPRIVRLARGKWLVSALPLLCAIAAVFLTTLALSLHAGAEEVPTVVTIGFAGPLSGDAMSVGLGMQRATEMAIAEANARHPRIAGKPVLFRLLAQDDQGNERTAALVANYLVKAGSIAVVGHWQSTASIGAAPVYHAAGIAQISPGSTSRQLTAHGFDNLFRVVGHDGDIGRRSAEFVQQTLHAKRIAIINDDTPYGTLLAKFFSDSLAPGLSKVVARHTVSSKTSDFNAAIDDLKTNNPDVIFFGGLMAQAAALQLNLKRTRINARMIAAGGVVSPIYLKLTGTNGEGTLGIAPGPPQEKMPGWKNFREKYYASYGNYLDYYAPFAYDATNVILAALKQAASLEPAQLIKALHSIKYPGLTGPISFDAHGDLNSPIYTIFQIRDGKWAALQTVNGI